MVVKVSSNINFPAQVNAVSPIVVTKTGGVYEFSLDEAALFGQTRSVVYDANFVMTDASRYVAYSALTQTRTVTLPAASLFQPATPIVIADESGSCSPTVRIIVQVSGTDHINASTSLAIETPYGALVLYSNGTDRFVTYP
jgi:hypothetical protein